MFAEKKKRWIWNGENHWLNTRELPFFDTDSCFYRLKVNSLPQIWLVPMSPLVEAGKSIFHSHRLILQVCPDCTYYISAGMFFMQNTVILSLSLKILQRKKGGRWWTWSSSSSSLLCSAPNTVLPTCNISKDVGRYWKGIALKQQLFLQSFLLPSIAVFYIMWWCESHLRHPALLLLWRCFWWCSPFLLIVFKFIRKLFITHCLSGLPAYNHAFPHLLNHMPYIVF